MKNPSRIVAFAAVLLAACSSNPKTDDDDRPRRDRADVPSLMNDQTDPLAARREERRLAALDAEQLYWRARTALDSTDFPSAIDGYDRLSTQYPFSPFATQGKLERMYALYRNFEPDRALSSADRFLREHPRHPEVDYVYYLKGLVNFRRNETGLAILPMDETRSDITSQRRAFDDFSLLLQRYPDSKYAGDAYDRMVFIRNRISEHELHVVDFYVRRGAYVAAAKRAEQLPGQCGPLVRADAQLRIASLQPFQRLDHAREDRAQRRYVAGVDLDVSAGQSLQLGILKLNTVHCGHPLDQPPGAVANALAHVRQRNGRQLHLAEDNVERPMQVRRRIDQRAVEVEHDGASLKVRCGKVGVCRHEWRSIAWLV